MRRGELGEIPHSPRINPSAWTRCRGFREKHHVGPMSLSDAPTFPLARKAQVEQSGSELFNLLFEGDCHGCDDEYEQDHNHEVSDPMLTGRRSAGHGVPGAKRAPSSHSSWPFGIIHTARPCFKAGRSSPRGPTRGQGRPRSASPA